MRLRMNIAGEEGKTNNADVNMNPDGKVNFLKDASVMIATVPDYVIPMSVGDEALVDVTHPVYCLLFCESSFLAYVSRKTLCGNYEKITVLLERFVTHSPFLRIHFSIFRIIR